MRLLTVIDSLAVGGAEHSLAALTPHLVAAGVDAHVAYLIERPGGVGPLLQDAGATIHLVAGRGGRLRAVGRLRGLVDELDPDIVHTTLFDADLVGRVAGRWARKPVVSSFVTEAYGPEHVNNPEYRPWKVRAAQLADASTARLVTRFHAVSKSSADVMSRRLRVPRDRIDVIPRGRNPDDLGTRTPERRARVRASLGLDDATPLVVAAGRHYHMKGLDMLVTAFGSVARDVDKAVLAIAGRPGPATSGLVSLAAEGGVTNAVRLLGYRSDVPDLMAAADVFVLPSRAEGSPGVLIEAMALEVPVVATSIPSIAEVAGTDGVVADLVEVGDIEAMAAAITALLTDPDRAARLADAARRRFLADYTMEVVAGRMMGFYGRVLAG
jgi:glycosyltransferase involved in cell wall biosynthesis